MLETWRIVYCVTIAALIGLYLQNGALLLLTFCIQPERIWTT